MIKLKLDHHEVELTDDNFVEYESAIREAVGTADYASVADTIWQQVQQWAGEWSQHPDEYTTFSSYQGIVESVATHLRLVVDSTVDSATEIMAQHILDLKECWVDISHDPTEASQVSRSLDAVSDVLRTKLTDLQNYESVGLINQVLPSVFVISNKFLSGGYSCHHDAAKEIATVLAAYTFDSLFEGMQLSQTAQYQVNHWSDLKFSSRM